MKTLKVLSVHPNDRDLRCEDENGRFCYVDVYVDGGLGDNPPEPKDLIGRYIQCDSLDPYIQIANGVKLK